VVSATRTDLHGDLVGGAADATRLDLELGAHVLDGALEDGHGIRLGARANGLERAVDDALGDRALAALEDLVDHLGDEHRSVDRVGHELATLCGSVAGH
jgi:hypothetical protein